jgi:hypothetical protein
VFDEQTGRKTDPRLDTITLRSDVNSALKTTDPAANIWRDIGPSNLFEPEKLLPEMIAPAPLTAGLPRTWFRDPHSGLLFVHMLRNTGSGAPTQPGRRIFVIQQDANGNNPVIIYTHPENDTNKISIFPEWTEGLWEEDRAFSGSQLFAVSGFFLTAKQIFNGRQRHWNEMAHFMDQQISFGPGFTALDHHYMLEDLPPAFNRIKSIPQSRYKLGSLTWKNAGGIGVHGACIVFVKDDLGGDPGYTTYINQYKTALRQTPQDLAAIAAARTLVESTQTVIYNNFASADMILYIGVNDRWVVLNGKFT